MSLEIDAHAAGVSPVHRWDARAKVAAFGALALAVASCRRPEAGALGVALAVAAVGAARLPARWVAGRLRAPLAFLALFFFVLPFTVGGPAWRVGPIALSTEGLRLASLLTLKGAAVVLVTLAALGTAPFHRSMRALEDLGVPRRLVELLLFVYRYVFVFAAELERKRLALRARSFGRHGAGGIRTASRLVGTLLVEGLDRTERIERAMRLRAYTGRIPTLEAFSLHRGDVAKAALTLAAAAAVIVADRWPR